MSLSPPQEPQIQFAPPPMGAPLPADTRVLGWATVAGLATDLAIRAGVPTVATALLFVTGASALLLSGRVRRPQGVICVLAAAFFGAWVAVRSSPWLVVPDILTAVALLAVGAGLQPGGDLFDLDAPGWLRRVGSAAVHTGAGAAFLLGGVRATVAGRPAHPSRATRAWPVVRGAAVAAPVVLILGALLRSADPVFASFVSLHVDGANLLAHLLFMGLGAWAAGGLLRLASLTTTDERGPRRARLGTTEALVVLGGVDVLFALFAVAQLVAASGGAGHVLRTTGLTYADYARSGYFQLLWVAGITLALLVLLDTLVDRPRRAAGGPFGAAGAVAAVLTILIAVVAFRRLALYENTFGLTMLRLSCQVFAVWVIAVFVLLAISLLGAWSRRRWFAGAALAAGLIFLFAFNAINPEAVVARRDLRRGNRADVSYLAALSDDAVPTILGQLGGLGPAAASTYTPAVCAAPRHQHGWASFNLARSRAERALGAGCAKRN